MSDETEIEQIEPVSELPGEASAPQRRSRARRIGCGCILAVWFLLLLTPCVVVYLATTGEITIKTGDLPGQEVRVWLMTEDRNRGVGISSAAARSGSDANNVCLQTDVRYLLWAGRGDNTSYCECYTRADAGSAWTATDSTQGACPAQ